MEQKKTNGGLVAIITILVIALVGVSGYVIYDKSLKEKEPEQEEGAQKCEEEKKEVLDVTSEEVVSLLEKISSAPNYYCWVWDYYKEKRVEAKDISNNLAFNLALRHLNAAGVKVLETGATFTADQVDQEIHKYFGKNYQFTHESVESCPKFTYDPTTKIYTVGVSGCGGTCGYSNFKKIVKAVKFEKTIELGVRVLFAGSIESSDKPVYYQDYQKTKLLTDLEKDYYGFVENSDANLAKGTLYKMVFTLEDGNYVFTSSEPVNE